MKAKIALGLGDNTDYEIVWNSALLEKLIRQYAIRQSELETNLDVATDINSERELVISILSFLNAGRGGERWVASSELVEAFAHRFEMKITLGGTSVRSAIAMRKLHPAFEHIGVVAGVVAGRIRPRQAEQFDQFAEEKLVVGEFRATGAGPAGDEGVDAGGVWAHGLSLR